MFRSTGARIPAAVFFASLLGVFAQPCLDHPCGVEHGESPEALNHVVEYSPDFFETLPDGSLPQPLEEDVSAAGVSGPIAPASGQPIGALTGRIVYTSGGHGWTKGTSSWFLQRPVLLEMNEDYGNLDQMNFFALYCFNAGATVVPMRPIGNQTNEVVLDNDDAGVVFSGTWNNSSSPIFYGSPGDLPYRFASLAATETATATYTPNIPVAGFYPVYTWVRHGSDRTSQLYRIRHTGGESLVRVPHHMVGNGWVYLGTYYFNAGSSSTSGAVIISNLQPSPSVGSVIIADAIRFGNGMSTDGSTYPKEEEASRYWVKNSLGQGQSTSIYNTSSDDQNDNVGSPPRMAVEMNRHESSPIFKSVYIGFHSNAGSGSGRGVLGLHNANHPGTSTPNQFRLAQLCGREVNDDMLLMNPFLEVPWFNRGNNVTLSRSDIAFGEINNSRITNEFDATIIEVAYHDNSSDALLLRDPKVRNWLGRASYHAVVKYMNEFDGVPLNFLPEPPTNVRAIANGSGGIVISWNVPAASAGSGAPTGYVVYQSTNGYGFGNPVTVSGAGATTTTLNGLPANVDVYFRVAAVNAGGESFPSETVGCRRSSNPADPRALIVNGFDRFERAINIRQTPSSGNYRAPGHNANTGTMDRVIPRSNNAFDYVVQHGKAVHSFGMPFDSCQNETVINGQVNLAGYPIVIWACGQESTQHETFSSAEQSLLTTFLAGGGNLFVSGSDIAWDLDRGSGPTAGDRSFLNNRLHADLASDAHDNSGSFTVTPVGGSIFAAKPNATFDSGAGGIYPVRAPDVLTPFGPGATAALNYSGGIGGAAAVQYDGSAGGGKVVLLGFPFETITSASVRNQYMAAALNFLSGSAATNLPPAILTQPQNQNVIQGSNATLTVVASGASPLGYQWSFNGSELPGATSSSLSRSPAQFAHSGNYQVVVSNAFGTTTSQVALLTVTLPPTLQTVFLDNFDVNTAANWVTNRSSTDTRVTFNYNHAPDGIPSAPNATNGTTRGVKFEANMVNGAAAAITISPNGQSFTGDYRLRFDMWINANGPFPLGGTGSTEHVTAGVATAGNRTQWTGAGSTADGFWFAVDGEGQASDSSATTLHDFCAFNGTTFEAANSGIYAAGTASNARGNGNTYYHGAFPGGQSAPASQQSAHAQQTGTLAAGTVGFGWRDVIINKQGSKVEWFIHGLKIATFPGASYSGNNIFVGYWDSFNSISDNAALSFGLLDNVRVEAYVTNAPPFVTQQPESQTVAQGGNATFTVEAGGIPAPTYQWRFNGFNIGGATADSISLANVQPFNAGNYSVVVSNSFGVVTSAVATLTIATPPMITQQPQSLAVTEGDEALFSVTATGSAPLEYQWQFNQSNLGGEDASTLIIANAQPVNAGNYRVIVSNDAGSVTSVVATLTVNAPPPAQLASAGVTSNGLFQLTITGHPGRTYLIEGSTNLTTWTPLTTITVTNGSITWTDPDSTHFTHRFYRAREMDEQAFTDFEGYSVGDMVLFRQPSYSGSTLNHIDSSPGTNNFTRITNGFPAGITASQVLHAAWTFHSDTTNPWLRLTTSGAPNIPNPTISFTDGLRFNVYTDRAIWLALGLRETDSTAPIGEDGGSTGAIEWIGGITDNTTVPPKGRLIPAGQWTAVHFFIPSEPVKAHTGNDVLESTTGKGVLENLTIVPADGTGPYNLYLDNFYEILLAP